MTRIYLKGITAYLLYGIAFIGPSAISGHVTIPSLLIGVILAACVFAIYFRIWVYHR